MKTYALDAFLTAGAIRRKIILEATLAIQFTLLLDESDIVQRSAALRLATNKVIRAPRQTQSGDKLSPEKWERQINKIARLLLIRPKLTGFGIRMMCKREFCIQVRQSIRYPFHGAVYSELQPIRQKLMAMLQLSPILRDRGFDGSKDQLCCCCCG